MSNAEQILEEISDFFDKSKLKKYKITTEEFIAFIEQKWQEADDEKYTIHYAYIVCGRMTNEYIKAKDFDNMMRWIEESDKHTSSKKNPAYILNYYNGECCLSCGNEEKALEYLNLSYAENPDYIFQRAPFVIKFFNQHLENPRDLKSTDGIDEPQLIFELQLDYWANFFNDNKKLEYTYYDKEGEEIAEPTKNQENGIRYLKENQEEILKNMLSELLKQYPDLQKKYNYEEAYKKDFMPDVSHINGFAELISPTISYVFPITKDDYPYIGFSFSCSWDGEHDLGFIVHKNRVVEIGDATLAFDIYTAEDDAAKN